MSELINLPKIKIHTSNSFTSTGGTNPISVSVSVKKQRRCSVEYACNMALSLMMKGASDQAKSVIKQFYKDTSIYAIGESRSKLSK